MISQEEMWALNLLTANVQNAQSELQRIQSEVERIVGAKTAFIKLLEEKYQATFDQQTGQFKPKAGS